MLGPDDQQNNAFVSEAHPAGKFPVLTDGDEVVVEATSIIEYLAVHHPGQAPLIPNDRAEAATVRMLDRFFDNYVMANVQRVVGAYIADMEDPDPAEASAGKSGLLRSYHWLETWLAAERTAAACFAGQLRRSSLAVLRRLDRAHSHGLPKRRGATGGAPRSSCGRALRRRGPPLSRRCFPLGAPDRD